jgi:hypothetical protein
MPFLTLNNVLLSLEEKYHGGATARETAPWIAARIEQVKTHGWSGRPRRSGNPLSSLKAKLKR